VVEEGSGRELKIVENTRRGSQSSGTVNVTAPLIKMLDGVATAFGLSLQTDISGRTKREQYVAALNSIAKFFDQIECFREGMLFFELASAIGDRNAGVRRHPLLDSDIPAVTRADSSRTWHARANVTLALEALIAAGESISEAAAKMANANQSMKHLAGAKSETLKTALLGWRKEFRQGRVRNSEASALFSAGRDLIETRKGDIVELRAIAQNRLQAAKRVFSPRA
jgi:hypothetical protein